MGMLSKDQLKEMIQYYDIKTTDDIKDAFKGIFDENHSRNHGSRARYTYRL